MYLLIKLYLFKQEGRGQLFLPKRTDILDTGEFYILFLSLDLIQGCQVTLPWKGIHGADHGCYLMKPGALSLAFL